MSPQKESIRILLAASLLIPSAAAAQQQGEMTFFSNPDFSGIQYTVNGERMDIRLPWPVRSVRIAPGAEWQVCSRTQYEGDCTTLLGNMRIFGMFVASARPGGGPTTLPAPIQGGATRLPATLPGLTSPGPSLRGTTAEFFSVPQRGAQRVISCDSGAAACTADSADRFCRSLGWMASSYQRQETVRGRNYLADVLCTRPG